MFSPLDSVPVALGRYFHDTSYHALVEWVFLKSVITPALPMTLYP